VTIEKILVPDLGGADEVDVIEVLVAVGDTVAIEDALFTLESDKASMEVPSPMAGDIVSIDVSVGDKVSEGHLLLTLESSGVEGKAENVTDQNDKVTSPSKKEDQPAATASPVKSSSPDGGNQVKSTGPMYAGPAVRRVAREFGVDLTKINGTGDKGRITKEDLQQYVRSKLQSATGNSGVGADLPEMPLIDYSKFGDVVETPLSKINKLSGSFLHRNWLSIPHVTQFEEVDIVDMEEFRQKHKSQAVEIGVKLTPVVFIMKALQAALVKFPRFNSSLSKDGQSLIMKNYFNIGVAVDTPNGLVVPVVRGVESKGLLALASDLGAMSKKAREKGLSPADMQGGCITISSLGGIGGSAFTPIINAPEVAILGVSKSYLKPVYNSDTGSFEPRLTLPVSLSYDHRVIDGAEAARFIVYFASCLADLENLIL